MKLTTAHLKTVARTPGGSLCELRAPSGQRVAYINRQDETGEARVMLDATLSQYHDGVEFCASLDEALQFVNDLMAPLGNA